MYNLYCETLGNSNLTNWIQKAEQVSNNRLAESLLVLPNSFVINVARQRTKIKCLSFDELVAEICARGGSRARLISRATQELLLEKILIELAATGQIPYFAEISHFSGYISAITSLIGEIKRAGVSPDEFASVAEATDSQIKHKELLIIYQAYQTNLSRFQLADLEEMVFIAEQVLAQDDSIVGYKNIMMCEFYVMTPLQLFMVKVLQRCIEKVVVTSVFEKNRTKVFGAVEFTYAELVGMGFKPFFKTQINTDSEFSQAELSFLQQNLFLNSIKSQEIPENIAIHKCGDRNQEVSIVAGLVKNLIVNENYRSEDIVVTARNLGHYSSLRSVLIEHGIPVDLPKVMLLSKLPVTQVVMNFFMVARDGFSRRGMLNIAKSFFVEQVFVMNGATIENCLKDYSLLTWEDLWSVTAELVNQKLLSDIEISALHKINRLIVQIPQEGNITEYVAVVMTIITTLEIPEHCGRLYKTGNISLELLKRQLLSVARLEEIGQQAINEFELVGQKNKVVSISDFIDYFSQIIGGQEVVLEKRDSSGVKVISPAESRGMKFPVVIVMGMVDGEFPGAAVENWLYSDGERALLNDLGVEMATSIRLRQLEDLYFSLTVALASERLIFTYYEDDKTLISPYLEEIKELFGLTIVEIVHAANEIFPVEYNQVFSPSDLIKKVILDTFNRAGDISLDNASVLGQVLSCQVDAEFWRKVDAGVMREKGVSPFSGLVGSLMEVPKVYSITDLEEYAKCPFKYFISRLLHIGQWSEKEEDAQPDIMGQIYHETLATFLRPYQGQTLLWQNLPEYILEMNAALTQTEKRAIAARTVYPGIWWQFERERISKVLNMWLEQEIAEQQKDNFRPEYLEWGFGLPIRPGMDKQSTSLPLILQHGTDKIYLRGKIDRIDDRDNQRIVLDYKRKTLPSFKAMEKGLSLQIPVYVMAVEQLLNKNQSPESKRVVGGGYYRLEPPGKGGGIWQFDAFPVKKKNYIQEEEWQKRLTDTQGFIIDYVSVIRAGEFPIRPASGACRFCYAAGICRYDRTLVSEEGE